MSLKIKFLLLLRTRSCVETVLPQQRACVTVQEFLFPETSDIYHFSHASHIWNTVYFVHM